MNPSIKLLSLQNPWWRDKEANLYSPGSGLKFEPTIRSLAEKKLHYQTEIKQIKTELEADAFNLLFITGAKGTGKSAAVKSLIKSVLDQKIYDHNQIFYYHCANITTGEQLNEYTKTYLNWSRRQKQKKLLILDEVANVKQWQTALNHLLLAKKLNNCRLILTSSLQTNLKILKFKKISQKNFNPISFADFLALVWTRTDWQTQSAESNYNKIAKRVDYYLEIYSLTGGFLANINHFFINHTLDQSIYESFLLNFLADFQTTSRDAATLKQILAEILAKTGQSVGYQTLAARTKAKTHLTIAEYLELLERLGIIHLVCQSDESGQPTTRKGKRIYFNDPFLFWLFYGNSLGVLDFWRFCRAELDQNDIHLALTKTMISVRLKQLASLNSAKLYFVKDTNQATTIDFVYQRQGKKTAISLILDDNQAEKIARSWSGHDFDELIIVTRQLLAEKKNIRLLPLAYFLLFFGQN